MSATGAVWPPRKQAAAVADPLTFTSMDFLHTKANFLSLDQTFPLSPLHGGSPIHSGATLDNIHKMVHTQLLPAPSITAFGVFPPPSLRTLLMEGHHGECGEKSGRNKHRDYQPRTAEERIQPTWKVRWFGHSSPNNSPLMASLLFPQFMPPSAMRNARTGIGVSMRRFG